jgi:hypothetical protein
MAKTTYFYHLIDLAEEYQVHGFYEIIDKVLSKLIMHFNKKVRQLSAEIFKIFIHKLDDEDYFNDFMRVNICVAEDGSDAEDLLDYKITFLQALIDDEDLNIAPILISLTCAHNEEDETQYK